MMDKMYWACADAMSLASQLSSARDLPSPDVLQRRISGLFEQMARKCRDAGIPEEDVVEARYAIAAFMDEQIFRSPWPGRQQWMSNPLQLVYFNENTAGEGFFTRIQQLQQQPQRAHVLQIFYLCVALGFQGKFAVRGGEGLGALSDYVGAQVARSLPGSDNIAPHGEPRERVGNLARREMPIIALSLAIVGLALIIVIALKIALSSRIGDATTDMQAKNPAITAPAQR
jgi:type VI secretion system protein ImpK